MDIAADDGETASSPAAPSADAPKPLGLRRSSGRLLAHTKAAKRDQPERARERSAVASGNGSSERRRRRGSGRWAGQRKEDSNRQRRREGGPHAEGSRSM